MAALLGQRGRACSQLTVAIGDPARCVCPPAKRHAAVLDADVRVVVLRLGELPDAVDERQRLREVAEGELALERSVHLDPVLLARHWAQYAVSTIPVAMVVSPEPDETASAGSAGLAAVPRAEKRRARPELLAEAVFRPLASVVVRALLPIRVSPTAVVLTNALAGLAAAVAIYRGELVVAALLLQLKTVLDNADGQLARASGRTTALGRYLDTEADLVVNAALFAALGLEAGLPLLAGAAFLALTLVLSANFNENVLHRRSRGEEVVTQPSAAEEGAVARGLARVYGVVFAPQDSVLQHFSRRRLERSLVGVSDPAARRPTAISYHDGLTSLVLANFGLSTQLAVLGVCLALGGPVFYLWFVVGCAASLPALQLRREIVARSAACLRDY